MSAGEPMTDDSRAGGPTQFNTQHNEALFANSAERTRGTIPCVVAAFGVAGEGGRVGSGC
jgi:hypothetical protein